MLKYAKWTPSRGYNIEKGRGGRDVNIGEKNSLLQRNSSFSECLNCFCPRLWVFLHYVLRVYEVNGYETWQSSFVFVRFFWGLTLHKIWQTIERPWSSVVKIKPKLSLKLFTYRQYSEPIKTRITWSWKERENMREGGRISATYLSALDMIAFRVCLQGGRVTPASGLTPAGEKEAWVYEQNFTGKVTLKPGTT